MTMSTREYGIVTVGLTALAGLLAGGAVGVLYAPQSGARTRRRLCGAIEDLKERVGEIAAETSDVLESAVDRGRRALTA